MGIAGRVHESSENPGQQEDLINDPLMAPDECWTTESNTDGAAIDSGESRRSRATPGSPLQSSDLEQALKSQSIVDDRSPDLASRHREAKCR
jgi:hypothetical protein